MAATVALESYKEAMIVLGAASVVVPLVKRLGISAILGFLFAGALLGPKGLGALQSSIPGLSWITVSEADDMTRVAELGVVFLLFLIGLELSMPRLLTMRKLVFGLGGLQVIITASAIGLIAHQIGFEPAAATIIGAAFALSSTAIVIEVLARQHRLSSATGRTSFSILLFQDLAVVPLLIFVGLLTSRQPNESMATGLVQALLQGGLAIAAIVLLGRLVMRPLFRATAGTQDIELFTAATLFVVVGTSLISAAAGLSMALGAFVSGLLLAETEYRRAVEATIEPFKGLLLGTFFFCVGMSLDIGLLFSNPVMLIGIAGCLILGKAFIVAILTRAFGLSWPRAVETGLLLGPAGEFAFVFFGIALSAGLIDRESGAIALAVASLTMASIPAMATVGQLILNRFEPKQTGPELAARPDENQQAQVIVVGYGRVGRVTSSMLEAHNISHLITDNEAVLVTKWRREGKPIYFGDARLPNFLETCGLRGAKAVIITINAQREIDRIVEAVRLVRNDIIIVSRAKDAQHARHLYELGVTDAVPETIEASLQLSEAALVRIGIPTGLVIASIHEKRDEFRHELQQAAGLVGETTRAIRPSVRR